jgi:hypothetical protein
VYTKYSTEQGKGKMIKPLIALFMVWLFAQTTNSLLIIKNFEMVNTAHTDNIAQTK